MDRETSVNNGKEDRSALRKRLKRKKRNRLAVLLVTIIILTVLAGVSGYFLISGIRNQIFNVKHVLVVGNETVDNKTVIDAANIPDNTSIFLLDMNRINQNIRENINCSFLMISKKFPDTIIINIRENPVICAISESESIYYLDDQYQLVETGSYLGRTDIPLITGLSGCSGCRVGKTVKLNPSQKAEEIRQILIILNNSEYLQRLSEIIANTDGTLKIITKNNLVIHLDDLAQFKREYDYIGSILEKNKSNQEVDLTMGEKIIVKNR